MQQNSLVKNLSFNPRVWKIFACGHEDGKIFIWSTDANSEPNLYFQFPDGHSTEGIEWHPNSSDTLMWGSKNIKIVKYQGNKYEIEQTIHTFRGKLNALRWKPGFDSLISYASESTIIILDRSRPFLNHYMINIDCGPVISFEWHKKDHILIAGKKNLVVVNMNQAYVPLADMNVAPFDTDVFDNIVYTKQENFIRNPKKLMKIVKMNNLLYYQSLKIAMKPKYDSILDDKTKGWVLGSRREYGERTITKNTKI